MASLQEGLVIAKATEADLPTLATIHARAFHPSNAYHREAMPDTPLMRQWWQKIFTLAMNDPTMHMLVVKDSNDDGNVVAIVQLKRYDKDGKGPGLWSDVEWTQDHDLDKCLAMIDAGVQHRKNLMGEKAHFGLELLGVDSSKQRSGAGGTLLSQCCDIADAEGLPTFVEANGFAEGFYQRGGFKTVEDKILPGDREYRECMMIRPPKK